jgi:spectrin beta
LLRYIYLIFNSVHYLHLGKHFAHQQLSSKVNDLEAKWDNFRSTCAKRSGKLQDALEVQQFYSEADELMQWLKEKQPELTSPDYGKDDAASLSYLKKLLALTNDIKTNQTAKCHALAQLSAQLQARDHYDKKHIARKQTELEQLVSSLLELASEREQHLNAMLKVFEFERECETTANWFKDQQVVAASQDFGTDLEHAETLLKKFNEFASDLNKNTNRIRTIDAMAQQLCENKYTPSSHIESIDDKCSLLNEIWRDLNTLADVRTQTLENAIEVHTFDKDCDHLITLAGEKERFLTQEDIGYDLASVYTLAKQQEALENELTALSEELERLNVESARLCADFPETRDHIETRLEDADSAYNDLLRHLSTRKDKINQSQAMFLFANEYNEMLEWLRETLLKITSAELAQNTIGLGEVNNVEMLIKRNREYRLEIDLQQPKMQKFLAKSDDLLAQARKIASAAGQNEIRSKTDALIGANRSLLDTWQSRQDLYEQNLEYFKLLREIKVLDAWLSSKDAFVNTDVLGDNVLSTETLLKQHSDFEQMLNAMEVRFESLKRENRLERTLKELRQKELASKRQADAQFEEEKKKDAERKRKLEKRRQDERRRTQEIIANVSSMNANLNLQLPQLSPSSATPIAASVSQSVEADGSATRNPSASPKKMQIIETVAETEASTRNSMPPPVPTTTPGTLRAKKDRNRTRSIRDRYKLPLRLPQPSAKDYLNRKQEFQKGGQRAPIREYQNFFTTIHANLMCFFLNEQDYNELNATSVPINLYNCKLNRLEDTTIQRDVIHLETVDGAEYLFDAAGDENNEENLEFWYSKLYEASGTVLLCF